jgi:NADH-quinone oxidoreductase E subunit
MAEEGPAFAFTPDHRAKLEEICGRYPAEQRRSAVLAALHMVQRQQGWVSRNAIKVVAEVIRITPAEVEDVVSYYTMFYTKPVGKQVIQVCRTLSCALHGAERVTEEIEKTLGIHVGETTADGQFTLVEVECLGACDRAPVVGVNDDWQEHQQPEAVKTMLEGLRARGAAALTGCHLHKERVS